MNQNFPIKIKGHCRCILKNNITGEKKEWSQDNIFFDQGLKNIIAALTTQYLVISDSLVEPVITDTYINGNILEGVAPSRTYTSNDYTHLFTGTFNAPISDRIINTIGISYNINGHLPWCGLKLISPITQTTVETLYIYYKVTVIKPTTGGSLTNDAFENNFAPLLFSNPFKNTSFRNFSMSNNRIENTDINILTQVAKIKKGNMNVNQNVYKDFSRYFKDKSLANSGDLTLDLGIWNSCFYGDTYNVNYGTIIDFGQNIDVNMIGRVWPKLKTATGDFFESISLPNGYGRAVHVKTPDDPFIPQSEQKFSIEIESNGDVGVGTYSIKTPIYTETFYNQNSSQYNYPNKYIPFTKSGVPYFIFLANDLDNSCIYKMNTNPISLDKSLYSSIVGNFINGCVSNDGLTFFGIDSLNNTNMKVIDISVDPISINTNFTIPISPLYLAERSNGNIILANATNIYEISGADGTTITNTILTNQIDPYSFIYDYSSDTVFYTSGTLAVKFPMTTLTEATQDCVLSLIDGSPAMGASIGIFNNNLYVIKSDGQVATIPTSTFNSLTDIIYTWQSNPYMGIISVGDNLINITTNNNLSYFRYQYSQLNLSSDGLNFNTITNYRHGQLSYANSKNSFVTFNHPGTKLTVTCEQGLGSTSIYFSLVYSYIFASILPIDWGWTGTVWEPYNSGTKLSHSTWENIPFDSTSNIQVRFYSDTGAPTNTLQNTDKYEFFVSPGLIKDNEQYIEGISYYFYTCNVSQITNEEITMTNEVMELPSKTSNSLDFLMADLNNEYEFYIKDSLGGAYTYWQTPVISNLNLSTLTSHDAVTSVFITDTVGVSNYFEYYKDMWLRFTAGANIGERQKILSYDWYTKEFTTDSFTNTPLVADTFLIENPQVATKTNLNIATPVMLSTTTPSGIVASSSSYATYYDWEAFDQTINYWQTDNVGGFPQWISYDFEIGNEIALLSYEIEVHFTANAPRSWILEGSNDGTNWTQIHLVSNFQTTVNYEIINFDIFSTTLYRIYRFTFTSGYNSLYMQLRGIKLYSYTNSLSNTNEFNIVAGNAIVSVLDQTKIIDGTYKMLTR